MLTDEIMPKLKENIPQENIVDITRLQIFGFGESSLQKLIHDKFPQWPSELEIGFRASMPILELKITSRTLAAKTLKETWLTKLNTLLGDHVIHHITDNL